MAVDLFPRIAGVKVESPWAKESDGLALCTARLTRALTSREAELLRVWLGVHAAGNILRYSCRREQVEDFEDRLLRALLRVTRSRADGVRHGRGRARAVQLAPARPLLLEWSQPPRAQ